MAGAAFRSLEAEDEAGVESGLLAAAGRKRRSADAIARESPGEERGDGEIDSAADIVGECAPGDGCVADVIGGVFSANHSVHEEVDARSFEADTRADQDRGGAGHRGTGAEAVVGYVALDAEERLQVNVEGALPTVEAAVLG